MPAYPARCLQCLTKVPNISAQYIWKATQQEFLSLSALYFFISPELSIHGPCRRSSCDAHERVSTLVLSGHSICCNWLSPQVSTQASTPSPISTGKRTRVKLYLLPVRLVASVKVCRYYSETRTPLIESNILRDIVILRACWGIHLACGTQTCRPARGQDEDPGTDAQRSHRNIRRRCRGYASRQGGGRWNGQDLWQIGHCRCERGES